MKSKVNKGIQYFGPFKFVMMATIFHTRPKVVSLLFKTKKANSEDAKLKR